MGFSKIFLFSLVLVASRTANYVQGLEGEPIIGGSPAEKGQFPYQVDILIRQSKYNLAPYCGGSILDNFHILTAAHCLEEEGKWENHSLSVVPGGMLDLNDALNNVAKHVINVKKAYVPTAYFTDQTKYSMPVSDIAVLKLEKSLDLKNNPHLSKITLPNKRMDSLIGETAVVSGYGYNYVEVGVDDDDEPFEYGGRSTHKLKYAHAKIIGNSECQRAYNRKVNLQSHICAQVNQRFPEGEGVCSGDSGGPLVYNNVQIGVVSQSPIGCTEGNAAGVYTRVSSFLDFISKARNGTPDKLISSNVLPINFK